MIHRKRCLILLIYCICIYAIGFIRFRTLDTAFLQHAISYMEKIKCIHLLDIYTFGSISMIVREVRKVQTLLF